MNFNGRTYIITGAASGLGQTLSVVLSNYGANLILIDINEAGLLVTKQKCCVNSKISLLTTDVTKFDELKKALSENIKEKVSGFVHCAGIPCISPIKSLDYETYLKVMQVNAFSALEIVRWFSNKQHFSPDNPSVCLVSSVYSLVGSAGNTAYAMSKGAINSMTKSLAIELASKGIRVNCVAPGFMHTNMETKMNRYFDAHHEKILEEMHPLGLGSAEDVANMICFLLSDQSKWTTGAIVSVDGGFTAQ